MNALKSYRTKIVENDPRGGVIYWCELLNELHNRGGVNY